MDKGVKQGLGSREWTRPARATEASSRPGDPSWSAGKMGSLSGHTTGPEAGMQRSYGENSQAKNGMKLRPVGGRSLEWKWACHFASHGGSAVVSVPEARGRVLLLQGTELARTYP